MDSCKFTSLLIVRKYDNFDPILHIESKIQLFRKKNTAYYIIHRIINLRDRCINYLSVITINDKLC